jgi:hypothetical protein
VKDTAIVDSRKLIYPVMSKDRPVPVKDKEFDEKWTVKNMFPVEVLFEHHYVTTRDYWAWKYKFKC